MSWLERHRPKKAHPWPPRDRRVDRRGFYVVPQPPGSAFKAVFARAVTNCLRDGEFHAPLPATAEEWRAQGFCYIGSPK